MNEKTFKIFVADKIGTILVEYLATRKLNNYKNCFDVIEHVTMSVVKLITQNKSKYEQVQALDSMEQSIRGCFDHLRNQYNIETTQNIFDFKKEDIKRIIVNNETFFTVKLKEKFDMEQIHGLKQYLVNCFGTENIIIHSDDIDFV